MSQSAYELILFIADVFRIVMQLIFCGILWRIFYPVKKDMAAKTFAVIFVIINLLSVTGKYPQNEIRTILSAAIILTYSYVHVKDCKKAVFFIFLVNNLHALSFLISNSMYLWIEDLLFEYSPINSTNDINKIYKNIVVGQIVFLLFYIAAFAVMVIILKGIVKKAFHLKWLEVLFLSVLNVVGSMLSRMLINLIFIKIGQEIFLLFDERKEMLWWIPLMAVLIYAGEISVIYFYQKYMEIQRDSQKYFVEKQQIKAMQQRLEETESFYGSIRKVRHEMKNHMTNIKGLVESEEYGEVNVYIRKLDETIQELEYRYTTGNPVTDVIINDKWRRAEKSGIHFEVDFHYTEQIPVFDIGIILNNLLDNAIEACEKVDMQQRYIRLTLKKKRRFLFFEIENSFNGRVNMTESDGIPETMKQTNLPVLLTDHGIGLKNVKEIAERYFGDLDIKVKGNVFKVTVMLQQRETL